MDKNEQEKLVEKEIKQRLINMHNGESLVVTLNQIMESIRGIRYKDEKKFIYILQGLTQDTIQGNPILPEDKAFIRGHSEAVDEHNFGVQIAISAIMDLDEGKDNDR